MNTPITLELASKLLNIIDVGLVAGMGNPAPGQMCVEAAVCFAMGLPHNDNPPCVLPIIRAYKIDLNDADWSSPQRRAQGLRRLGLAQLGSDGLDEEEFLRRVRDPIIDKLMKKALDTVQTFNISDRAKNWAKAMSDDLQGERRISVFGDMRALTKYVWETSSTDNVYGRLESLRDASHSAFHAITGHSGQSYHMVRMVTYVSYVTEQNLDEALSEYAEDIVKVLIDMNAPGCQWLFLTEQEA